MFFSGRLDDLMGKITNHQFDVIAEFVKSPVNWDEAKHGEKRKLEGNMTVVFLAANGGDDYKNVLEAHQKFYDLHYTMEGSDVIVWKPLADCVNIKSVYNEEGDYALYNEQPQHTATVSAGSFCLIPPADAHMALYGDCGFVRKLVFKIPVGG